MNTFYYQGEPGAYSNIAAKQVAQACSLYDAEIIGLANFEEVWEMIDAGAIGVLPIENSYAGPIHANLFAFHRHDAQIIGSYDLEVSHCLLSKQTDISKIKVAISHMQALAQCYHYLKKHNIEAKPFYDTAGAAKHIAETQEEGIASISSKLAAEIYGLNILDEGIQDQSGNTTRFLVVCRSDRAQTLSYTPKLGKVSMLFEAKHEPSSLYKCLGAFATYGINLTKIESLPSFGKPFTSIFWVDFEADLHEENTKKALQELEFFTSSTRILGSY